MQDSTDWRHRLTTPVPGDHDPTGPIGTRRTGGGFWVLPFVGESAPSAPATDATWAWSMRRLARAAVWLLPAYALCYGLVTMLSDGGAGTEPYPAEGQPIYLVGWIVSVWLGLLALLALAGLLVTTRSRRPALSGLLTCLGGTVLMLPFAGLAQTAPVFGLQARTVVLSGALVYSLGWFLTGWAIARSGVLSYGDGVLVMLASPLLGIAGALIGSLQTFGAMFVLAAGIGIAWRAGRLVPSAIVREAAAASVAGGLAPTDQSAPGGGGGTPLAAG